MSFWENKLNGTDNAQPVIPSRNLYGVYQSPMPQQHIPQGNQAQEQYQPTVRLKQGSNCPDCGSDKYMTHGSYAIACAECGYHPRFEQSGHGEKSLTTKPGQATPARQPAVTQTMAASIAVLNAGGGDHIGSI